MGALPKYEAYCDHCRAGVFSRDSLVMTGSERLCPRCCIAREAAHARVLRVSGWLLFLCTLVGAASGTALAMLWTEPLYGLFPGIILGLLATGYIEARMKRY